MNTLREESAGYRADPPQRELWSHEFLDALSLAYYQEIAERVAAKPALIEVAKQNIARWLQRNDYDDAQKRALAEWSVVLRVERIDELLAMMRDASEEGVRKRQSAPFAGVLADAERKQIKDKLKEAWTGHETASAL